MAEDERPGRQENKTNETEDAGGEEASSACMSEGKVEGAEDGTGTG